MRVRMSSGQTTASTSAGRRRHTRTQRHTEIHPQRSRRRGKRSGRAVCHELHSTWSPHRYPPRRRRHGAPSTTSRQGVGPSRGPLRQRQHCKMTRRKKTCPPWLLSRCLGRRWALEQVRDRVAVVARPSCAAVSLACSGEILCLPRCLFVCSRDSVHACQHVGCPRRRHAVYSPEAPAPAHVQVLALVPQG